MRRRFAHAVVVASLAGVTAGGARAAVVSAVEFWHSGFNHYFTTAFAQEVTLLDAGTIGGWSRTLTEFRVDDTPGPGLVPVCRFFSASFAPRSSHFYTPFADECAKVKRDPVWTFEGEAFYVRLPDAAGNCPAGTTPIYRYYNNGLTGAPNHKYTPYRSERDQLLPMGWIPEGIGLDSVGFCVPVYFDLMLPRTQSFADATWEFSYDSQILRVTYRPVTESGDPELPYFALVAGVEGIPDVQGFAGWDPYAAKIVGALFFQGSDGPQGFLLDYSGGSTAQGCIFLANAMAPCRPITGRRL